MLYSKQNKSRSQYDVTIPTLVATCLSFFFFLCFSFLLPPAAAAPVAVAALASGLASGGEPATRWGDCVVVDSTDRDRDFVDDGCFFLPWCEWRWGCVSPSWLTVLTGSPSGGGDGVGSDLADCGVVGVRGSDGLRGGLVPEDTDGEVEGLWRDLAECGRRGDLGDGSGGDWGDWGGRDDGLVSRPSRQRERSWNVAASMLWRRCSLWRRWRSFSSADDASVSCVASSPVAGGIRLDLRSVLNSLVIKPGFFAPPDFEADMVQASKYCEMQFIKRSTCPD